MSRKPVVIDTNVLIAANGKEPASLTISSKCAARLLQAQAGETICIDAGRKILSEYGKHLPRGRRGAGDMFYLWLVQRLTNTLHCQVVPLTADPGAENEFAEFPKLPQELAQLIDPSDRKFIAVSNAHAQKPPIIQGTDSKWIGWEAGLKSVNIQIEFIDKEFLRPTYEKKMGAKE